MTKRTLTLTGTPPTYTATLDGQDLSEGIRRLTIDVDPRNGWPRVEAELAIHAIEITDLGVKDSRFEVSMPDEARAALIALGWTPPGVGQTGIGGALSFSDATPIMTCQCGARCFGDSINDALKAWGGHVTTAHRDDWED
jgi:hypothetical protein